MARGVGGTVRRHTKHNSPVPWTRVGVTVNGSPGTPPSTLEELIARVEHRVRWKGQSVRAIHPFDPDDYALLQAIHRGEFNITGLS